MDLQTILTYFDVKHGPKGSEGYYEARCPVHDDKKASLIIGPGDAGIRVKCLANCRTEDVLAAVGLKMSDLFYEPRKSPPAAKTQQKKGNQAPAAAKPRQTPPKPEMPKQPEAPPPKRVIDRVYAYQDEKGATLFEVVRYIPKDFRQRVPDPTQKGGYRWSIKGVRPVIYHLPQVLNAIQAKKTVFVVEGEKDADNLALIGCVATTCPMGAGKWHKEHSAFLRDANVCILADNDEPGRLHAAQVAKQLHGIARSIRVPNLASVCPRLPEKGDISDVMQLMGKAETARVLHALVESTPPEQPPQESEYERAVRLYTEVDVYGVMDGGIVAYGKESVKRLSTFVALPTRIITKDDGVTVEKHFEIKGWTREGHELPTVTVKADDFGGMGWVLRNWDFAANVMPGNTVKEQLRYVMTEVGNQSASRETVYTHVGWRKIGSKWAYLHPGGAIGAEGVRVELEKALRRYNFDYDLQEDPLLTMSMVYEFRNCMAKRVSIPLLGLVFLAPLREFLERAGHMPRFAMWIKGQSGVRKSTASALALSFFGDFGYSDPLPASFNDTANSVRRKSFVLKDSLLVVDDYYPATSLQERRKMENMVQLLSRAYGNGDDRGRMTGERKLEDAMPSRGLAIMSGEQSPDISASGVLRFYMINVEKGDIDINEELNGMQALAKKGYLRKAMAEYIAWLSEHADELIDELPGLYSALRKQAMQTGKDTPERSSEAVAHLVLGYRMMLRYMQSVGAITEEAAQADLNAAWDVVLDNSRQQLDEVREDRPVNMFVTAVREMLMSKQANVRDISSPNPGLTPPGNIGLVDQQYYYLLPHVAYGAVCRFYADQGITIDNMLDRGLVDMERYLQQKRAADQRGEEEEEQDIRRNGG